MKDNDQELSKCCKIYYPKL